MEIKWQFPKIKSGELFLSFENCISKTRNLNLRAHRFLKIKVNWRKVIEVGEDQKAAKIRKSKIMDNSHLTNHFRTLKPRKKIRNLEKGDLKGLKTRKRIFLMNKLHTNQVFKQFLKNCFSTSQYNKLIKN